MPSILERLIENIIRASTAARAWAQGQGGIALGTGALFLGGGAILLGLYWIGGDIDDEPPIEVVEGTFFEIATGSITGTYYPLGNTIASIIAHPAGSVRCANAQLCGPPGLTPAIQAAEGSVSNIEAVHDGQVASAFAQADVVNQAFLGEPPFETAYNDLRVISGLYGEAVHLVTMRGSEIQTLADLRGHRVSIDRRGSGTFGIASRVLAAAAIADGELELVHERVDRSVEMLLAGEIDAFFYVAGAPVRAISDLANLNLARLIPLEGPEINALVAREPYLTAAVIPETAYLDLPATRTVGVNALWIVREDAPFELVYAITRALWHPQSRALLQQGPEQARYMRPRDALQGIPIPIHPGAEQYYLEIGLLTAD